MIPEYEKTVDLLLEKLLGAIQNADERTITEMTVELRSLIDEASAVMETDREWKYATYAIVAWVDFELITHHNNWKDETLESYYFKSGNAYSEFFSKAESAYEKGYFNAFEVFFICFMFGFHGMYQTGDQSTIPKHLPKTDVEWQKQAASRVSRIRKKVQHDTWGTTRPDGWDNAVLQGRGMFFNNLVVFGMAVLVLLFAFVIIWAR